MSKKMIIGTPYIKKVSAERVRLCADVTIGEDTKCFWYEVDAAYGEYLCTERSDAFVINFLLFAMREKLDIECEQPMTESIHYHLVNLLIPATAREVPIYHSIKITTPVVHETLPCEHAVGTGVSGGVDSFYTIIKNLKDTSHPNHRITHLLYADIGGEKARTMYWEKDKRMQDIAAFYHLPVIHIDSNINDFVTEKQEEISTYRLVAMGLALQKFFSIYYLSSSDPIWEFAFCDYDPSGTDLLLANSASSDTLEFIVCGAEATRQEKVQYIANDACVQRNLNVCVREVGNCGHCMKCMRELVNLYSMDMLDEFSETFDTQYFYDHKKDYLKFALRGRDIPYMNEAIDHMRAEGKISKSMEVYEDIRYYLRKKWHKLKGLE